MLYEHSIKESERDTSVLYYDCTNFFFEITEEEDFRKYGKSKENRPNPIIQMGMFIDGSGIPLAFDLCEGNKNEQITLKPLEKCILQDFNLKDKKLIICSDAGLSSEANRKFNNTYCRDFIVIQSIKKLDQDTQK